MEILESNLGVRLRKKQQVYNYLADTYKYQFVNDERNEFNVAIRQRSKDSVLCGDSYVRFSIKNKKYVLISDGMGHGVKAGKDSSAALFLLKNFIELGMTPENSIKSCNALILDKEKECFNTLDLLEYDLFENKIYLYKNGSGATYLNSKNNVKRINSENLPLGIIEDINVEKININTDTDYIVLTSDGLRKDLKELLINTKIKSAKSLVNAILENEGNVIEDDQTIVVINVIKK